MSLMMAISGGLARGLSAWRITLRLWLMGLLFALPATVMIEEDLHQFIGSSLAHETLRGQMDLAWLEELKDDTGGVTSLISPSRLSPAAVLENLELWFSGDLFRQDKGLAALGVLFILFWTLMSGGVLAQLNRSKDRRDLASFLTASSRYFFRFLRLVAMAGLTYYLVYRFSSWLFPWIEHATRDVTAERTVLIYNLIAAAIVMLLIVFVRVTVDYAKISTVLEERRSMSVAALRGLQFVVTHPLRTFGVYLVMGLLGLLLAAAYYFVVPDVEGSGWVTIPLALLVGQIYLLLRWVLRISLLGAESIVFQSVRGYLQHRASSL